MRMLAVLPLVALTCACDTTVELPKDPVERALTCALGASFVLAPKVQAADNGNIPSDDYAQTFYYVERLAAAKGDERYNGYAAAMQEVGAKAGEDNSDYAADGYQTACRAAYPNVGKATVALPADDEQAAVQCIAITRFAPYIMADAVKDADSLEQQGRAIMAGTEAKMTEIAAREGLGADADYDKFFDRHFAKAAEAAPFVATLDSCEKRFGGAGKLSS